MANPSRRFGLMAGFVVASLCVAAFLSEVTAAAPCNGKKAVIIGCPIAQQECGTCPGFLCAIGSEICFSTTQTYNNSFRCDPVTIADNGAQYDNKWLCAQGFVATGLGVIPATAKCQDIVYCKVVFLASCGPDENRTSTKVLFTYDTSHLCDKPG